MTEEQIEKQNKLAEDVLHLSRNTLLVNLRFMDAALLSLALMLSSLRKKTVSRL